MTELLLDQPAAATSAGAAAATPGPDDFWQWFNQHAAPKLALREPSFRQAFEYLDTLPDPIRIVETGCLRTPDNWVGDGQSSELFRRYKRHRGNGAQVFSVDIDPQATARCRQIVGDEVAVHTGDSVAHLANLTRQFVLTGQRVSLYYLDSFDVNFRYPFESAAHHLKELVAISPVLTPRTLVMVDDCPQLLHVSPRPDGGYAMTHSPAVGGKGFLVAEYAAAVGAKQLFAHYQVGYNGFNS